MNDSTGAAIAVEHLSKRYGEVVAVDDVTFSVRSGTTTGLLGGNGAGKTTTLSMLVGLLLPTSGQIRVLGRMNYSSPYVDLPFRLTVWDNLRVYAGLYGLHQPRARILALAEELNLGAFLKRGYGSLSAGQKTRVALAKALLNEPDVLLMDEPTASLDPDMADYVRNYLKSYQGRTGATLLLASHNMTEVERICDDVVILREGRRVDQGAPRELIARYGRQTLEDVFLDIARRRHADDDAPPGQQRTASP